MTQPISTTTNDNNQPETLADLIVTTARDEDDGDYSVGDLSLREAIALANEQEGADTITFDASLSGETIAFNNSQERELLIDDSLLISGLGQDNLTLDGGFIVNIAEADLDVTIEGLNFIGGTIENSGNFTFSKSTISKTQNIAASSDYYAIISRGNANIIDSTIKDNSGGSSVGIVIESGTANIERSAITGNDSIAYAQSGIIIRPDTTVNISNSTIANNQARSTAGIENAGGTVNITNSTIANNRGGLSSGGINNFLTDGVVTITSSIIANNSGGRNIGDISGDGEFISGGNNLISNGDDATGFINGVNGDLVGTNGDDPENPQLVGNGTDIGAYEVQASDGGGIANFDTLTISNSIIRNNSSELNGGGIYNRYDGTATVTNTTINDNLANNGGAGIENRGTLALSNSTIHNNSGVVGSGINNQDNGVLTVDNSTITNNFGGGIYNRNSATLTSSIIADNSSYDLIFTTLSSDYTGSVEDDVVGTKAFTSGGNNLIGSKDGFGEPNPGGFTDGVNGDLVGTLQNPLDPQLGELQDNGGTTPTRSLLEGSPAIDAGSNPNNLATDQRGEGFARTVGNGTDMGAYEVQDSNTIEGTSGNDLLLGTVDDDLIDGLEGSDILVGDTGDDNLSATGSNKILLGNEGDDTLYGSGADYDFLVSGEGVDVLFTESGNSTFIGGAGYDSLSSSGGNNIIQGNEGDDILISSTGGNILLGRAGSDRFNLFI